MTSKIQVVAAVVFQGGKFLLGKRSSHKKSAPGYWCPISGGIEVGETQAEAAVREVYEEVGLIVEAIQKLDEFDTHDGTAVIHWWQMSVVAGKAFLKNDEHSELTWVTIDELKKLHPIFKEDIAVYERVAPSKL